MSNISAILHEGGHALYELGLPAESYGSPLCESISLGIHESQSRFWETRIGQSLPFWKHYLPLLKKTFKGPLEKTSLESFYKGINKVIPSFIRVEADEVTYSLHIILRFELEVELIQGTLSIREVPEAWNAKMQELLGIVPPTNTEGCLQDIHWSMGGFGYFPTYTLGNLYAAQLFEAFEKQNPTWKEKVAQGELLFIRDWLHQNVYQFGRMYSGKELLHRVTQKTFSEGSFIDYLNKKYKVIYS
jgi:carboxypeptidase Taq